MESELRLLKQSVATETGYGLAKITESSIVTEKDSGLVLSAREKNPAVDGTLANTIKNISNKENINVSWNNETFPGSFAENIAWKINRTIYIKATKHNGVSHIPVGERVVVGKIDNYKPSFTKISLAASVNINGTKGNYCGIAQIQSSGDISVILEKACDWLLFIEFLYLI